MATCRAVALALLAAAVVHAAAAQEVPSVTALNPPAPAPRFTALNDRERQGLTPDVTVGERGAFGRSIAMDPLSGGATAIVGAPLGSGGPSNLYRSGAAFAIRMTNESDALDGWTVTAAASESTQQLPRGDDLSANAGLGGGTGAAVAIRGDVAVAGARFDSTTDSNAGAVLVWERVTPTVAASEWALSTKLAPSTLGAFYLFGHCVALDTAPTSDAGVGVEALCVGAYGRDGKEGAVYCFDDSQGWAASAATEHHLTAPDSIVGGAMFGYSLAMISVDGALQLFVGAPSVESATAGFEGGVVFRYTATVVEGALQWGAAPEQALTPVGGTDGACGLGISMAVTAAGAGYSLLAGAACGRETDGEGYVFHAASGAAQVQSTDVLIDSDAEGARTPKLGEAVALDGAIAVLASPFTNRDGIEAPGMITVFTLVDAADVSGSWIQLAQVSDAAPLVRDNFGASIAISSAHAVMLVGVSGNDQTAGEVRSLPFQLSDGEPTWSTRLTAIGLGANGIDDVYFSNTLVTSGDGSLLAAGAMVDDPNNAQAVARIGAVHLYSVAEDGEVSALHRFEASDGVAGDFFGVAVAVSNDGTVVVGSPRRDVGGLVDAGAAHVYVPTSDSLVAWTETALIPTAGQAEGDLFGRSAAISGSEGFIAVGAPSAEYDSAPLNSGSVHVFVEVTPGTWEDRDVLVGHTSWAAFGSGIAVSGDLLFCGSPRAGTLDRVDVYQWSSDETMHVSTIHSAALDVGSRGDTSSSPDRRFGATVAASPNGGSSPRVLAVGAVRAKVSGIDSGQAFLFLEPDSSDGAWQQIAVLEPAAPTSTMRFSWGAVAVADSVVAIGASFGLDEEGSREGRVFLFACSDPSNLATAPWVLVAEYIGRWTVALVAGAQWLFAGQPASDEEGTNAGEARSIYISTSLRAACAGQATFERGCMVTWPQPLPGDTLSLPWATIAAGWYVDHASTATTVRVAEGEHLLLSPSPTAGSFSLHGWASDPHSGYDGVVVSIANFDDPAAGETATSHIQISNVVLEARGDRSGADGGVFELSVARGLLNLELSGVVLRGGRARRGGGIFVSGSGVAAVLRDCTIEDNSAHSGGAIYVTNDASVQVTGGTLENNHATLLTGGVIAVDGGAVAALDGGAHFVGNTAMLSGGAVAVGFLGQLLVDGATVSGCIATSGHGGGIHIGGGARASTLSSTTIEGCRAGGAGGGFAVAGPSVSGDAHLVESTVLSANNASRGGGLWSSLGSRVTVDACTVENNVASDSGGGAACEDGSVWTIQGETTVSGNRASTSGGGILLFDCETDVSGSTTVSHNVVDASFDSPDSFAVGGGGISVLATSSDDPTHGITSLRDVSFSSNTAPTGGALLCVADRNDARCLNNATECASRAVPGAVSWVSLDSCNFDANDARRGRDVAWVHRRVDGIPIDADVSGGPVAIVVDTAPAMTTSGDTWPETIARVVDADGKPSIATVGSTIRVLPKVDVSTVRGGEAGVSQSDGLAAFRAFSTTATIGAAAAEVEFIISPGQGIASVTHQFGVGSCGNGSVPDPRGTACVLCGIGEYKAHDACEPCPPGRYANERGLSRCKLPLPSFVAVGVGATAQRQCSAGEAPNSDADDCEPCAPGTISTGGVGSCTPCATGFAPDAGRTVCERCAPTEVSSTGEACSACPDGSAPDGAQRECLPCMLGTASSGGQQCSACSPGRYANSSRQATCWPCRAGRYQPVAGHIGCKEPSPGNIAGTDAAFDQEPCGIGTIPSDDNTVCETCPANATSAGGVAVCTECSVGRAPDAFQSTCVDCAPNQVSANGESCEPCDAGTMPDQQQRVCVDCAAGRAGTDGATCAVCGVGKYSGSPRSTSCDDCPVGQFQDVSGQAQCRDVTPGYVLVSATTQIACSAGRFADYSEDPLGSCAPCTLGFVSSEGAPRCDECPRGTFEPGDGNQCEECPAGTYAPHGRQEACTPCEDGFSSNPGAFICSACNPGQEDQDGVCVPCGAGLYSVPGETAGCVACAAGSVAKGGAAACDACSPGYAPNDSKDTCELCAANEVSATGLACQQCLAGFRPNSERSECEPCPPGTFGDNVGSSCSPCQKGTAQDVEGQISCAPCGRGNYTSVAGQRHCVPPLPGWVVPDSGARDAAVQCPAGTFAANTTHCLACEPGSFASAGSSHCSPCAAGFEVSATKDGCDRCGDNEASSDGVECQQCAEGWHPDGQQAHCVRCPLGSSGDLSGRTCTPCGPGRYADEEASTTCEPCGSGQRSEDNTGSAACVDCGVGKYPNELGDECLDCADNAVSLGGVAACTECQPGWRPRLPDQDECEPCPVGTFGDAFGRTCQPCSKGKFSDVLNATACEPCAAGHVSDVGASGCKQCDPGFQPADTLDACERCIDNEASASGVACLPCWPGSAPNGLRSLCELCPEGTFGDTAGRTCTLCPAGRFGATDNATSCAECDPGWTSAEGAASCTPCPEGTKRAPSDSQCVDCLPGTFAPESAALACVLCPAGTYASDAQSRRCSECPVSTYSSEVGVTTVELCQPCPENTGTSLMGATSASDCRAIAGFFALATPDGGGDGEGSFGSVFAQCPEGADCAVAGVTIESLKVVPGYWRASNGTSVLHKCLVAEACVGGKISGNDASSLCRTGHTGPTCSGEFFF